MNGEIDKKSGLFPNIVMMASGLFCAGVFIYAGIEEPEVWSWAVYFVCAGLLLVSYSAFMMFMNSGSYLTVDAEKGTVKAKYACFGKLDCKPSDIAFVMPQLNSLTVVLKNGKKHSVFPLKNAREVSSYIRKLIYIVEKESPELIEANLLASQKQRKKYIKPVIVMNAMTVASIIPFIILMTSKDTELFSNADWVIFYGLIAVFFVSFIICMIFASKCGKLLVPIEWLTYRLRGATILNTPLLSNNIKRVYADADNLERVTVCGFPNDDSWYYYEEIIGANGELIKEYESKVFPSTEDIDEKLSGDDTYVYLMNDAYLVDITEYFKVAEDKKPLTR